MTPEFKLITTDILAWHRIYGRQNMPWTKNRTPYRVWVSEIMLQQTQVSTAHNYYLRFMQQLPTLQELANAEEDKVLALWSGLGYYSRARNLHRAAKLVQAEHNGHFPKTLEGLIKLPGIGRSTAGAILSLAMKIPTPILDGNVKRIITRFYGVPQPVEQAETQKKLWSLAAANTPQSTDCVLYTQAIMDFGATQCQRRPNCTDCPLQSACTAYQTNTVNQLPNKTKKVHATPLQMHFVIVRSKQYTLLLKRPGNGIWAKLWCLPPCDSKLESWLKYHQIKHIQSFRTGPRCTHRLSHRVLDISTTIVNVAKTCVPSQMPEYAWKKADQEELGLPQPIKKILQKIALDSDNQQTLAIPVDV